MGNIIELHKNRDDLFEEAVRSLDLLINTFTDMNAQLLNHNKIRKVSDTDKLLAIATIYIIYNTEASKEVEELLK